MKTKENKSRFWRICRICFRRFRITLWLVILVVLGSLLYLNQIGLPNFVKNPLLEKLRARGLDLQFSRLRLRWYQGIVAENVRFGRTDDLLSPQLTLREVKVSLDRQALKRLKFGVESLTLRQGRLVLPVAETNGPARELSVENIQTELRLLPDDRWALDHLTGIFAGASIRLSGTVSHASAVREWKFFSTKKQIETATLQNRVRQLADTLESIHFSKPPDLKLDVAGDARDPQTFSIRLLVSAPDAETPWGAITQGSFAGRLSPAISNEVSHAQLRLTARSAQTSWGAVTNLQLAIQLKAVEKQADLVDASLTFSSRTIETQWGSATNVQFTANWMHALTNPIPLSGKGHFCCEQAETQLGGGARASTVELTGRLDPEISKEQGAESWAWWTNIAPYALNWECHLWEVQSPKIIIDSLAGSGTWRAPQLIITNFHAELYNASLEAGIELNVSTRALHSTIKSDVDARKIYPLLTEGARRWLDNFSWEQPPRVKAQAWLTLPAWTNQHPDWRHEVQPVLRLDGQFIAEQGGAYRQMPVTSASSHFTYSNMMWRLPDLTAKRPEGQFSAFHQASDRTKEFYWRIESTIDPNAVQPLLETNVRRQFDLFNLTQPPLLKGEVWGRFHDPESIGVNATVSVTNFTFRGENIGRVSASIQYTNRFLLVRGAEARYGTQYVSADSLGFDISAQKIYLTNGFSTADPQVVARAIGPKISHTIEPYHFEHPPTARVHGVIPTRNDRDADLHFDLEGGPFNWLKFHSSRLSGHVHWKGERLSLENVRGNFYAGNAVGAATFDFKTNHSADFQFNLAVSNAALQFLMSDISPHTNNLEGRLSGMLIVNKANTADWHSWQGGGQASLSDGLLWEIPVFGIFSPILNAILPGLGNSPATAASGNFSIVDGVIRSDDLEIRSPAMRLQYRGTVDFQGQVDARVEAELLRDMWLLGPLVSTVLWPVTKVFEYKLSGSLNQPKTEQAYLLPKIVLMPFHPFRTFKDLFPEESGPTRSKTPP